MYIPVHSIYLFCNSSHFKWCFLATDPLAPLPHGIWTATHIPGVGWYHHTVWGGEDVEQDGGEGI